ncbi:hypothetical protein N8D56_04780 [Devosia sp. A8/3-2]|nr:hypothetical protein N8D56_04780 [Devosia sp. A8/3-2]
MSLPDRQQRLAALRDTIADIERKPVLAERPSVLAAEPGTGFPLLAGGLLQEIFTDERRNSGAILGFCHGPSQKPAQRKTLCRHLSAIEQTVPGNGPALWSGPRQFRL